jgi:hypothetical protein
MLILSRQSDFSGRLLDFKRILYFQSFNLIVGALDEFPEVLKIHLCVIISDFGYIA